MPYLLDTHTFIWFINGDQLLSEKAVDTIKNINNKCFISIASIWEIVIKSSLNKLQLTTSFDKIKSFLSVNEIEILPITFEHIQTLTALEPHHRDPFDRIIISQSIAENLSIITKDDNFGKYSVRVLWQ